MPVVAAIPAIAGAAGAAGIISGGTAAAIGAAGAVGSAVMSSRSAKKASAQQAQATQQAASAADPFASQRGYYQGLLRDLYSTGSSPYGGTRAGISGAPMTATGGAGGQMVIGHDQTGAPIQGRALSSSEKMQDWMSSNPAYQFARDEGIRGLSRSAAASGMLRSGNYLRDLVKYSSGLASQTYEGEVNRLMTLSGATAGSPATAGQLSASAAQIQTSGSQNAAGQLGYGIRQAGGILADNPGLFSQQGRSIMGQTGYGGGASGVLSGAEFDAWQS